MGRFTQAMPGETNPKFKGVDKQDSALSAPTVLGDAFDFTQEQVPIRWRPGAKKGYGWIGGGAPQVSGLCSWEPEGPPGF